MRYSPLSRDCWEATLKIVDCGYSGKPVSGSSQKWSELEIEPMWSSLASILSGSDFAREVQKQSIGCVLNERKNLIVSAPTNSGKSLVGDLVLIQSVLRGGRAILVEPLRALAQEKFEKFKSQRAEIQQATGIEFDVQVSTGDYRLENEQFDSPPNRAQLIITTPERLDAILRNPDFADWVDSIAAVCIDEAHLISDRKRGPTIEYVLSFFKSRSAPPRFVLLSASVSDTSEVAGWLSPCESIVVHERHPALQKQILDVCDVEANDAIGQIITPLLADRENCFLIFVYQTRSAVALAKMLCEKLESSEFAMPYHSKMSSSQRAAVRAGYEAGTTRCVVATTSLALGVNLPATHVVVKDLLFHGEGRVAMPQLLQMCGRAGRGDRTGSATLIFSQNCGWELEDLANKFREEELPALTSSFQPQRSGNAALNLTATCEMALKHLTRFEDGQTNEQVEIFFRDSLGGSMIQDSLQPSIQWLSDPCRMLIGRNESDHLVSTALGAHAIRSTLPLNIAAGVGQLIRDLLELDPDDQYLQQWSPLDHLIALDLLSDRSPSLRRFSEPLAEQANAWIEAFQGPKPLLYREWIRGAKTHSKAAELLGSLGIECDSDLKARSLGYLSTFRSIILQDRGNGIPVSDIERRWNVENLSGIEEQWRDTMIWLLNALARVMETRCFYFHLKEHCDADQKRVKRIERCFRTMRRQIFGLQDHLKFCSPLGGLLKSIKRTGAKGIGVQTIRKLEREGVQSIADLASWSLEDYQRIGIQKPAGKKFLNYLRRRRM